MADEAVVLKDTNGNYYLLDARTLEAARVPPDQVARLEEALEPEVAGHAMSLGGFEIVGMVGPSRSRDVPHIDIVPHADIFHADRA
jgi:uncharacterized membrane protein